MIPGAGKQVNVRRLFVPILYGLALAFALAAAPRPPATFAELGREAVATIATRWYAGGGRFRLCSSCATTNSDWGADSLVDVLALRVLLASDPAAVALLRAVARDLPAPRIGRFSDVPMWDAVAAVRVYDATGDPAALAHAERDYRALVEARGFALGGCAAIDAQLRDDPGSVRTLETDANRILAAALLARRVRDRTFARAALADARRRYAAIRRVFLDPQVPLYTVYAFARGGRCVPVPRQFFASVNGRMIEAGLELAAATGAARYAREARDTAAAIGRLVDARGVFVDLQAQNDVVAPLVVAFAKLASTDLAARRWIARNAAAASHARGADGSYARFFDGPPPPPRGTVSVFETNGGLALAIAAAAYAPDGRPPREAWSASRARPLAIRSAPATIAFRGSGIALVGPLPAPGEPGCVRLRVGPCEGGRVGVLVDGRAPLSAIGVWQGKALVASRRTVLFAWRWPSPGEHRVALAPVAFNGKQGGTYTDLREALILP